MKKAPRTETCKSHKEKERKEKKKKKFKYHKKKSQQYISKMARLSFKAQSKNLA